MSPIEVIIKTSLKMFVIWGSCAAIALPIAKVIIEFTYEIWRERNV